MDLGISGRVALVLGASKGIGRAVASELAAEGARVAVARARADALEASPREIGAIAFVHDNADLDRVPALVEAVTAALGPIEILVTNTGGPPARPDALAHPREEWELAHRTLVLAPLALIERRHAGHARARLGADRQHRVLDGARAVAEPDALQQPPLGDARRVQDDRAPRSPRRASRSTACCPGGSRPSGIYELSGGREQAEEIAPHRGPGRARWGRRRSSRRRSRSCARSARATSPASGCSSTAASSRLVCGDAGDAGRRRYPQGESNPRYGRERPAC